MPHESDSQEYRDRYGSYERNRERQENDAAKNGPWPGGQVGCVPIILLGFSAAVLCAIGGCNKPVSLTPVDASVANVQPLPVADTEGQWKGWWKFDGNNVTGHVNVYIDTTDGQYTGELIMGLVPNNQRYRAFDFVADKSRIRFSYQLVVTTNAGQGSLTAAAKSGANQLATANSNPVHQCVLEILPDGNAKAYDWHPDKRYWEHLSVATFLHSK